MSSISRRLVLRGMGHAAVLGSLASTWPRRLLAAEPAAAAGVTTCLSMLYPSGDGKTFDADSFRDQHMGVLREAYGDSVQRVELRVPPPAAGEGAAPPKLLASVSIWIRDLPSFASRNSANGAKIGAAMTKLTNASPWAQVDQIIASLGEARGTVPVDTVCISNFYPTTEGATWETDYYAKTYLPKLYELYGAAAVRRIEATVGAAGGGGAKPPFHSAVHLYLNDLAAFDAASQNEAITALDAESLAHSTIRHLQSVMRVHAVG